MRLITAFFDPEMSLFEVCWYDMKGYAGVTDNDWLAFLIV
jgi:hypothetical protein